VPSDDAGERWGRTATETGQPHCAAAARRTGRSVRARGVVDAPDGRSRPRRSAALGALAAIWVGCVGCLRHGGPAAATSALPAERAAYVVTLGTDTIMAEVFSRTDDIVEGDLVDRSPTTAVTHYSFALDSRGDIARFDAVKRPGFDTTARPAWRVVGRRVGGGFDIVEQEGDRARHRVLPAPPEAMPVIGRSIGVFEIVTARLHRLGVDSLRVSLLDLGSLSVTTRMLRRLGADTVVIPFVFPGGEHARVDAAGHILGVSGLATTFKWRTEPAPGLNIQALASSFADRERTGGAFGALSSRDTARASIGGAHITINYGRPSKRGRAIFGALVPWGEVWRTGADLATHLTTDRELTLGNLRVPAGTYTLYTIPSPSDWQLIVNRQTGQGGLTYSKAEDVGRVTIAASSGASSVERLTITVEGTGPRDGVIKIAWDDRVAVASFSVAAPE
jgi:hypothetical protein